jgi:hypothetical protein
VNLADWLLEQIAADEEVARASLAASEPGEPWGYGHILDDGPHIARWDPGRVLAECAAKRAIIERYQNQYEDLETRATLSIPCWAEEQRGRADEMKRVLRLLAQPYRDRAGYLQ